jgi:methionyl aminopeptidase
VTIDSDEELEGLVRAGRVVAEARDAMVDAVRPGVTTGELDSIGRETLRRHSARSAPRVTYNFPGSTCISLNDEAAHGIPSFYRHLREGDLVNIDVSAELDGYFSDTGVSTSVGVVTTIARRLLDATQLAQRDAMKSARAGNRMRDIGKVVESHARRNGFRSIRNLYGHGIGRGLHEEPSVPSFNDHQRLILHEGMVLAVEPFLSVSAN